MAQEDVLIMDDFDMSAFTVSEEIPEPVDHTKNPEEKEIIDQDKPDDTVEDKPVAEENKLPERVGDEDSDDKEDSDKSEASQPSPYSSFAKALFEEGVLPSLNLEESKIESVEDLINAVKNEIEVSKYANLTDTQKAYLKAIESGIPEEDFKQVQKGIQTLDSITPEELSSNPALRKELILAGFKSKGYDEAKALKMTERSIAIGEDEADALDSLTDLKEAQKLELEQTIQQQQAAKLKAEEANKENLLKFKQAIMDTKEIIPGVKINNKIAEKVFEQATKPVFRLPNGQMVNEVVKAQVENPVDFQMKVNYLFYITKGFSDFSKIATSQKTKVVQEFDDLVKGNTFAPKASVIAGDMDYTPPELKGSFDPSIIDNII